MYDEDYAQAWIADHESGKDVLRSKFIMPFLKDAIKGLPKQANILDVVCGWGIAISHLGNNHHYYGIDVTPEFFKYIRKKYNNPSIILQPGRLPGSFAFKNNFFDLIICSMSLHTVEDLGKSFDHLFPLLKKSGKLIVVDFNDASEKAVAERFTKGVVREGHCWGLYLLDSGSEVEAEIFFHGEKNYEAELSKHGTFIKKELGPVFVGYEARRD